MKLKFIGKDGSMGLLAGKVYDVYIRTEDTHNKIVALIDRGGWFGKFYCPYDSPQAFAKNWSL